MKNNQMKKNQNKIIAVTRSHNLINSRNNKDKIKKKKTTQKLKRIKKKRIKKNWKSQVRNEVWNFIIQTK